jgi:hypothetical protein
MQTTTQDPVSSSELKYEKLSDLYLALWKQLDLLTGLSLTSSNLFFHDLGQALQAAL